MVSHFHGDTWGLPALFTSSSARKVLGWTLGLCFYAHSCIFCMCILCYVSLIFYYICSKSKCYLKGVLVNIISMVDLYMCIYCWVFRWSGHRRVWAKCKTHSPCFVLPHFSELPTRFPPDRATKIKCQDQELNQSCNGHCTSTGTGPSRIIMRS